MDDVKRGTAHITASLGGTCFLCSSKLNAASKNMFLLPNNAAQQGTTTHAIVLRPTSFSQAPAGRRQRNRAEAQRAMVSAPSPWLSSARSNSQSPDEVGSHATRHTSHVTRHTPHVTCHTPHATRHTSHVTRHTSHVTRHTPHVTCHTPHATRHTSHVTRHASHVTRHTSHVT
jgi:hypothetical protein